MNLDTINIYYKMLQKKIKNEFTLLDLLFCMAVFLLGILVRIELFPVISIDYTYFLENWVMQMKQIGSIQSLSVAVTDYPMPYTYFLTILSLFDGSPLVPIKLFSCLFDLLLAVTSGRIVYAVSKNLKKSILTYTLVFFLPTVWLNSSAWAQCDSIYVSFLLLFLLSVILVRPRRAMIYLSIAFSMKLQTVFVLPLLIILLLDGRIKIRQLFWIPFVYGLMAFPAWLFGRSGVELLKIYIAQTGSYEALTLEYYNFYTLVNGTLTDYIGTVGMLLAVILIGIMCYLHVSMNLTRLHTGHEVLNSATYYLVFLLFSAAGMLYFLPHMHERYGFLVDIVVVIYVMLKEKKFYLAIIWQFLSLMFYGPFLLGTELISEVTLSVIMLATMVFIGKEYYESYKNSLTL